MRFVIIGSDGPEAQEKRKIYRDEHLRRLRTLDERGRLILAGPFGDQSGSLIIIEADSIEEAEEFIKKDPYVINGVFTRYEVKPWLQVFPEVGKR